MIFNIPLQFQTITVIQALFSSMAIRSARGIVFLEMFGTLNKTMWLNLEIERQHTTLCWI